MNPLEVLQQAMQLDKEQSELREKAYRVFEQQKKLEFEIRKAVFNGIEEERYKSVFHLVFSSMHNKYFLETSDMYFCAHEVLTAIQSKGKVSYFDIINNKL